MPVIQSEGGALTVKGLPVRWGRRAWRELQAEMKRGHEAAEPATIPYCGPSLFVGPLERVPSRYDRLCAILDQVTNAPLPVDATDAHICVLAARYAADCAAVVTVEAAPLWPLASVPGDGVGPRQYAERGPVLSVRDRMANICAVRGIQAPSVADDAQAIARCVDPAWWRRNLRRVHGRAFEAAAIRLGFVSSRAGAYASDETVKRRIAQNERNKAALEAVRLENETGYQADLSTLASKTTANKRIRRGELMLRLSGCEAISKDRGDVGLFVTLTAPSKYHAVLEKSGTINPKYCGVDPRGAQEYLRKTWAKIRTAYGKRGIMPYGFRIAEPHHDGCVHWHMLLFMPGFQVRRFKHIVKGYALAEDGDEPGAQAHRVTFERIDASKGSAAAYLAKYISKNINDDTESAHDEVIGPDGEPVRLEMDKSKAASQRVDAWAGVWGIRQFQPIGQPPVTVWREMRRVKESEVREASASFRAAWDAAQRVQKTDDDGVVTVEKVASFADYIRAQGGVCQGRDYRIAIAIEPGVLLSGGRYGLTERDFPAGLYERTAPEKVYKSTRYTWRRVEAVAGAFDVPRSPVNNCTERAPAPASPAPFWWGEAHAEPVAAFDDVWFNDVGNLKYLLTVEEIGTLPELMTDAVQRKQNTVWTILPGTERMITKLKEKRRTL